ncbi:unnamed protein product [Ectocarpus sp. CCAP 1310/34]|nr:unnamed protein product [Ectocarpus sp. CCAP 1310/34]
MKYPLKVCCPYPLQTQSDGDNNSWGCHKDYMACIDPDASCVDDDDVTAEMVENCQSLDGIGDGYCEDGNNKAECGTLARETIHPTGKSITKQRDFARFRGHDHTPETLFDGFVGNPRGDDDDWLCSKDGSGFACIDPDAPCVDDDDITIEMAQICATLGLGDGWCDQDNNNEICGRCLRHGIERNGR